MMVIEGSPDPPDEIQELSPPICGNIDFLEQADDSEDEIDQYEGYEPLPLGPVDDDLRAWNSDLMSGDSSEDEESDEPEPMVIVDDDDAPQILNGVPPIESVDREVTRDIWTAPREQANIEMDFEKAQEVMSAMANFSLPASSFPEWAQSITEDEWKQQLANRINVTNENS